MISPKQKRRVDERNFFTLTGLQEENSLLSRISRVHQRQLGAHVLRRGRRARSHRVLTFGEDEIGRLMRTFDQQRNEKHPAVAEIVN